MRTFAFNEVDALGLPALVTITRAATAVRFTTYHEAITVGGITWEPAPGAVVSNISFPSDGSPSSSEVHLMAVTGGIIAPGDCSLGLYDGWPISILIVDPDNPSSTFTLMPAGSIIGSMTEDSRGLVTIAVNGPLQQTAREVTEHYALTGREDLGDARCKVDLTPYTVSVTGQATDNYHITLDSMPESRASDATWFKLGGLSITSGRLAGFPKIPIRAWEPSTRVVSLFLPVVVGDVPAGTAMNLHAGCDQTREMCFSRFNNIINLRAETFVPPVDPTKVGTL